MSNLFDRAMPYRNAESGGTAEVKCRYCGTWHKRGRLAGHVKKHKESNGEPDGRHDRDSGEGEA